MKINIKKLDLDLYYDKLDNGLEVYVIPKKNFNGIYATFTTKFGSNTIEFMKDKKMIKVPLGIAHFLEHKLFEQKDGIDPFSFYSNKGADANANTNQKKTTFLFSCTDYFEENINYLLDYVQEPYFTDKNVSKEKGIIEQEIKMYQDDPDTVMYESLINNMFVSHPMKYPIIGTIDSINSINKESLYDCYNTFYNPNNMFLVITGNVPDNYLDIIKENQKKKSFKNVVLKTKKYKEPNGVFKVHEDKVLNVSIPKCAIGYKIKRKSKDLYKEYLYLSILFDSKFGPTSNFIKNLIEDKIINSDLFIDFDNTEDHIIVILSGEGEVNSLLDKIKNEINNLYVSESEFNRKKKTLISSLIYVSDNIFSLNHSVMNDVIRYHKFNENRYSDIMNLNYDEFNELVSSLDLSNYSSIIIKK